MTLFFRYCVWVLMYMGMIFYLSHQSAMPIEVPEWVFYFDKVVHGLIFGVLGFLFLRAWLQGKWHTVTWKSVMAAILFTILYGITDEYHQSFIPGRTPDYQDLIADGIGAAVICLSTYAWFKPQEDRGNEVEST